MRGRTFSRTGSAIKSESDQLDLHPPRQFRRTLEAIQYLEGRATASAKPAGIVLRYGAFYGKDTRILAPATIDQAWPNLQLQRRDDEPAEVRDWLPALAQTLGAKRPLQMPAWLGRPLAGEHMVVMMTQMHGGSNAKANRELGWSPAHPSWREDSAQVLRQSTA